MSSITSESYQNMDFSVVINKVLVNLKVEIENSGAEIIQSVNLPQFYGSETEFIFVVQSLIQNAIKYNSSSTPTV